MREGARSPTAELTGSTALVPTGMSDPSSESRRRDARDARDTRRRHTTYTSAGWGPEGRWFESSRPDFDTASVRWNAAEDRRPSGDARIELTPAPPPV